MPIFNPFQPGARAVSYGDNFALFAPTDVLSAGSISTVFTPFSPTPGQTIEFTFSFASAPMDVVNLYGSNTPPTAAGPQGGILIYTSTNTQFDNFLDSNGFAFYWAQLASQSAGGALSMNGNVQSGQGDLATNLLTQLVAQATLANYIAAQNSTNASVDSQSTDTAALG